VGGFVFLLECVVGFVGCFGFFMNALKPCWVMQISNSFRRWLGVGFVTCHGFCLLCFFGVDVGCDEFFAVGAVDVESFVAVLVA
jgi:hypothetical protein